MPTKLGVIGGGVMGEALIARLVSNGIYAAGEIVVGEPSEARRQSLSTTYGIQTTADNHAAIAEAEIVLIAVKPQAFPAIANDLSVPLAAHEPLLISIMAGVTLKTLEDAVPGWPVVRAMPNTPATVGAGVTAIAAGRGAQPSHLAQTAEIFGAVGTVVTVPEALMDAVTGLSGSGPGYVAIVIEALADGGVAAGLPRTTALELAIQTVRGTAELLNQSPDLHPAMLKDRVTSPGGTTIAGIAELEAAGVRSAFIEAVRAACDRARALGS